MTVPTPWQPTVIRRFIQCFPTSACTVLVATDAGNAYVKAIGNDEGPHTLVAELVGTRLAKWFGLRTLEFAIIEVTDIDEIRFHNGNLAHVGPAFATKAVRGETWSGTEAQLRQLTNPADIARLVVFDTWTKNCDRYSMRPDGRPRINQNNVFLSTNAPTGKLALLAIDHTHCFTCGAEITTKLRNIDIIQDQAIYGLFPAFRAMLETGDVVQAASDLRSFSQSDAKAALAGIPREWGISGKSQEALAEFIVRRAAFVADHLPGEIEIEFGRLPLSDE